MDQSQITILVSIVIGIQILHSVFGINLRQMARQINDLYNWHDKEDDDGVKVWYIRQSLESAVERIGEGIEKQNDVFHAIRDMLKDQHTMLNSLEKLISVRLEQENRNR